MIFPSSPALRRIRQLARLIRRHPDLPAHSSASWHAAELSNGTLPDPAQFVDSSVTSNDRSSRCGDANPRRKHVNRPHSPSGQ
jgi:hypothetical protein